MVIFNLFSIINKKKKLQKKEKIKEYKIINFSFSWFLKKIKKTQKIRELKK